MLTNERAVSNSPKKFVDVVTNMHLLFTFHLGSMRKHLHEEVHVLFKIRTKEEVIILHGIKLNFFTLLSLCLRGNEFAYSLHFSKRVRSTRVVCFTWDFPLELVE